MKITAAWLILGILINQNNCNKRDEAWKVLFNEKDLNDWQIKIKGHAIGDNFRNTFRVENGLIRVRYDQYENFNSQFGHLYYKQQF